MIYPGEEIHGAAGQRFRVVDVVIFEEAESPFVGQNVRLRVLFRG